MTTDKTEQALPPLHGDGYWEERMKTIQAECGAPDTPEVWHALWRVRDELERWAISYAREAQRAALTQRQQGGVGQTGDKLWCETCEGSGKVYQEHQHGCHVGGEFPCPDCDGNGYWTRRAAPPAQPKAIAWVPMHPKTGPLWAMATDDPSPERLPSYPLRGLAWTDEPPAQPQSEPLKGWKLVPVEPTTEQMKAGGEWATFPHAAYRAMLAAALAQPPERAAQQEGGVGNQEITGR